MKTQFQIYFFPLLDLLDTNHESNKVISFISLENLVILIASIIKSTIITIIVLVIFLKIKKCLSIRKKYKENYKINKLPVTFEVDSKLNQLPTTLEDRIIADMNKADNKKKLIVSNCNEVNENWLPENDY